MEKCFTDKMVEAIKTKRSVLCVGLDPQLKFMPPHLVDFYASPMHYGGTFEAVAHIFLHFNMQIIDAVEPYAVAVKPQIAFYETYGHSGVWAFEETVKHARSKGLVVILDAKRGDGGDTAQAYADGYLGEVPFFDKPTVSLVQVDALTVHGYIGESCLNPFIEAVRKYGTGIFVVDKTSFKPNSRIEQLKTQSGLLVWQELAKMIQELGTDTEGEYGYRNVGVVMGATYPEDAIFMRQILPNAWFLVPGYGKQGGGADGAVVGFNRDGLGGIVNSSRGIIAAWQEEQFKCPSDQFAQAAAKAAEFARDDLNAALERAGKTGMSFNIRYVL